MWRKRGEEVFIIDKLVHRNATMVNGIPGAGKTTLAAHIATAIASGASKCLGQAVRRHGDVVVIATDPGDVDEWKHYHIHAGDDWPHNVYVGGNPRGRWDALVAQVAKIDPALFILDNVLGVIDGDIISNEAGSRIISELDRVIALGVPVLAVHHSSHVQNEGGGYSKRPMGSTVWSAWHRHKVTVSESGSNTVTLSTEGNVAARATLTLDREQDEDGQIRFSLVRQEDEVDHRLRAAETQRERVGLVNSQIVGNPELASAETQRKIAAELGIPQTRVSRAFRAAGGFDKFEHVPGVGWRRLPEAAA